ncbi:UNVERIFIED_CONTAM: hypothetical protein Sradi_5292600, partial [Sesamum radiatum]
LVQEFNRSTKETRSVKQAYAAITSASVSEVAHIVGNRSSDLISDLMEALRVVQNKTPQDPVSVHFAEMEEMAGMGRTTGERPRSTTRTWIVDSGATSHICGDVGLFYSVTKITTPINIHLPDNRITFATHRGDITLSPHLTLTNVLLVPRFSYNLLSVSQLCTARPVSFLFLTSSCTLQDQETSQILAI